MKTKYLKNLAGALALATLAACGGSGSCPPGATPTSSPTQAPGELTLNLTAPNQYPAGVPVTAYLTITNPSQTDAKNLYFEIPDSSNYTGTVITVANGAAQPCLNINAGDKCTFPVVLTNSPISHPGSFTVTATPNGKSGNSIISKITNALNSQSTLSLTANIGLLNVPVNIESGANGITFLYSETIIGTRDQPTYATVTGMVNSATAGNFNTINLTDKDGNKLNFSVLSGNSGPGKTDLAKNSIVTFLITIPANETGLSFYAQTYEDNTKVDQSNHPHHINVAYGNIGILNLTPNYVNLTTTGESITFTLSNSGAGDITNLDLSGISSPLGTSTTCSSGLAVDKSCTYTVINNATFGGGAQTLLAQYSDGTSTKSQSAQVNYTTQGALYGLAIASGDNPGLSFTADTVNTSESAQITLTNTGGTPETDFEFTLPQYFSISPGVANSCTLTGNKVTNVLNHGDSCSLTLIYANGVITSQSSAQLTVNYKFNSNQTATPATVTLTYKTVQASALLVSDPVATTDSPFIYSSLISSSGESSEQVFTITNNGSAIAATVGYGTITGDNAYFSRIPSLTNDCDGATNLMIGESCNVTIKFGPSSTNKVDAQIVLPIIYTTQGSTTQQTTNLAVKGTVRDRLSANVIINSVSVSNATTGNGESATSSFGIESGVALNSVITLTYVNTADTDANNFAIDLSSIPSGYSLANGSTCGLSVTTLQAHSANSCTVLLSPISNSVGQHNLVLSSSYLNAQWSDENGNKTNQQIYWMVNSLPQSTVYVDVYLPPVILVTITWGSTNLSPIFIDNGQSFVVTAVLVGGASVPAQTLSLTGGWSANNIGVSPATCTLQSVAPQKVSCSFTVSAISSVVGSYTAAITNSGNVSVVPASFDFLANTPVVYPVTSPNVLPMPNNSTWPFAVKLSTPNPGPNALTVTATIPNNTLVNLDGDTATSATCSIAVGAESCLPTAGGQPNGIYAGSRTGTVMLTSSASGYHNGTLTVTVAPRITLTALSTSVSLGGQTLVTGTIPTAASVPVAVVFTSSNTAVFTFANNSAYGYCTIPVGSTTCSDTLYASNTLQGAASISIAASGYASGNPVTINAAQVVTPVLTTPTIQLGGSTTVTATLPVAASGSPVVVTLTSSNSAMAYFSGPSASTTCSVPVGQTSCTATLFASATAGGYANITASTTGLGYQNGVARATIPNPTLSAVFVPNVISMAGGNTTATLTVTSQITRTSALNVSMISSNARAVYPSCGSFGNLNFTCTIPIGSNSCQVVVAACPNGGQSSPYVSITASGYTPTTATLVFVP